LLARENPTPMSVTVFIPQPLRIYCNGAAKLELTAPDVRSALDELSRSHPRLYRSVCDETDNVRRHINLFVNRDHVRDLDGLATTLKPGDDLVILPAVSGG
jgi:molybdopterin converting factor small subunit